MGLRQSKDEMLYEKANSGDVEGVRALRREGVGLEWTDSEGKTPLMAACMTLELYNVAKTLIELGANVNAYRAGRFGGTPLHHAAKRGLEHTVKLLLEHGGNALIMNGDCQTPLDIARAKGFTNVVRAIEGHVCLFSGWLREIHGPGFLELLAPQLLSRRVWVVVLPCGSRNHQKPFRLELAIYTSAQDAQPRTIVLLWKADLQEPNFNQPDPVVTISNISRIPRRWRRKRAIKRSQEIKSARIRLGSVHENGTLQLQQFANACKGISQVIPPTTPFNFPIPTAPAGALSASSSETDASLPSTPHERPVDVPTNSAYCMSSSSHGQGFIGKASSTHMAHCEIQRSDPSDSPAQHFQADNSIPSGAQILSADSTPSAPSLSSNAEENKEEGAPTCTICFDAPLEGACVPCGHMAGCMMCLNEIMAKKWGCPVCRATINQVIRIYSV